MYAGPDASAHVVEATPGAGRRISSPSSGSRRSRRPCSAPASGVGHDRRRARPRLTSPRRAGVGDRARRRRRLTEQDERVRPVGRTDSVDAAGLRERPAGAGKPDHVERRRPSCTSRCAPFGLAGVTLPQGKPGPFRPGPVSCGLFGVFAPPLGYGVSNHCVKNWVSRALHDALFTGRWPRKTSSSCGSRDVPAAVGRLDVLHRGDHPVARRGSATARRTPCPAACTCSTVVNRLFTVGFDGAVRPERRARRVVVAGAVEPADQALLERGVAGRPLDAPAASSARAV